MNATATPSRWERLRSILPSGRSLPAEAFDQRHRGVLVLLWVHVAGLAFYALLRGYRAEHAAIEGGIVAALTLVATWSRLGRRVRASVASVALITCSAVLVHLSGGYIEAHFHFFVMLGVIALYEDWIPFLLAIGYVVAHHGTLGMLAPSSVFNHPGAARQPWLFAGIHALFVLGLSAAIIVTWRLAEENRERTAAALSSLTATLESTHDGILVVDRDGAIVSFNRRFVEMWRLPEDILASKNDARAIAHVLDQLRDPAEFVAKVRDLYASDAESFDTLEFKDGRVFERYSQPRRLDGVAAGRVWSFRDITERRRAEEERHVAAARAMEIERLQSMNRLKTQLLNTASHELNTPLTPIRLQLHILRETTPAELAPKFLQAVTILDRNVARLSALVADILDVARLQNDRLPLEKQPVALRRLASEAIESFGGMATAGRVELRLADGEPVLAVADERRLVQVLYNLVSNALKFTPAGGRVSIAVTAEGEEAVVSVADTGAGLDAGQIARLFQPFTQVHDPMTNVRVGTGLGLYISRGIVEHHGGRIWCESGGTGRGTTFTFAIPLQGAPPAVVHLGEEPIATTDSRARQPI